MTRAARKKDYVEVRIELAPDVHRLVRIKMVGEGMGWDEVVLAGLRWWLKEGK